MIKTQNIKGFTLAELMISLLLGIALTGVVIATYISSKASFRATEAVSRVQESTRFAVSFLTRDIRMAGYSECNQGVIQRNFLKRTAAYSESVEHSIFGWEFDGTDAGETYNLNYQVLNPLTADATAVAAARTSNAGAAGDWDVALPALIAGFQPLVGSDILAVSISEPLPASISVKPIFDRRPTTINLLDSGGSAIASGVNKGQVLKVGDCSALDIFQNEAVNTATFITPGVGTTSTNQPGNRINADFRWQKPWGADTSVFTVDTLIFYIGTGASGSPSLFRFNSSCGLVAGCVGTNNSELIEGVENLQVLYGEDTDLIRDGVANQYVTADAVSDFADVASVKLGLLMRSVATGKDVEDTDSYDLITNITINPPDSRFVRSVKNTTVQLLNKGL